MADTANQPPAADAGGRGHVIPTARITEFRSWIELWRGGGSVSGKEIARGMEELIEERAAREMLLRECEPVISYAANSTPSPANRQTFICICRRIRAAIGGDDDA